MRTMTHDGFELCRCVVTGPAALFLQLFAAIQTALGVTMRSSSSIVYSGAGVRFRCVLVATADSSFICTQH